MQSPKFYHFLGFFFADLLYLNTFRGWMDEDALRGAGSGSNADKDNRALICLSRQSAADEMEATGSTSGSTTYSNPALPTATFEQFELFRRDLQLCDVHLKVQFII